MSYTYLIGWSKLDKWYYGVRYAKNCSPSDLWVTYFTSSKYVKEFREENGEPDIIQVRQIFKDDKLAIRCEDKVIRTLKLYSNERFLNKSYSGSIYYDEDVRKKMSDHAKKPRSEKYKEQRSITMKKLWLEGVYNNRPPQTNEHKRKNSEANKGRENWNKGLELSEEHKNNIGNGVKNSKKYQEAKAKIDFNGDKNPMFGRKHSEETKQKMREAAIKRKQKNKED